MVLLALVLLAQLGETPGEMAKKAGRVGVSIEKRNGVLVVDKVDAESDAAKQGINVGDQVLRIDFENTTGMGESNAQGRLRGLIGSTVQLTILPRASMTPKTLTIARDVQAYPGSVGSSTSASAEAAKRSVIEAKIESVEITGGSADEEEIRDAFARGVSDVATCVTAVGEMLPNGITEIGANLTFRKEGSVSIRTDPPSADLASCIGRRTTDWKMPKAGAEPTVVKVRWTLVRP